MSEEKGGEALLPAQTNCSLTAEETKGILKEIRSLARGITAVSSIICTGDECIYRFTCPFFKLHAQAIEEGISDPKKLPLNLPCPVEESLLRYWIDDYVAEFNVDPKKNPSEMRLICELAELELLETRATKILASSENQSMIDETVVGWSEKDRPITSKQIHQAFEIKDRLKTRREKLLKEMVGTRREKYRREAALNRRDSEDSSTKMADFKALIKEEIKKSGKKLTGV